MKTLTDRSYVLDKVAGIIESLLNIHPLMISEDYEKENLLGRKFHLTPRELVYLFFEIEKEFQIQIPQEAVIRGDFKTIERIVNVIHLQACIVETVKRQV